MTTTPHDRPRMTAARRAELLRELYELHDIGAVERFTHRDEPHRSEPDRVIDMFTVTLRGGREADFTLAQARIFLRGFFLGRDFPRGASHHQPVPRRL
jgi:hypothetical protein